MEKLFIKNFLLSDLEKYLINFNIPKFHAEQIFSWIYKKGVTNFSEMTNLSKKCRDFLDKNFILESLEKEEEKKASDETIKYLFKLFDGNFIESVVIFNQKNRKTLCISSQVGCKYACKFCASGMMKFKRNLMVSEIIDQILYVKFIAKIEIDNYVFMGMGEPFDNYENLILALKIMNDKKFLNIASRRITVSTNGLVNKIEKFKNFDMQVNLAVSLHSADQSIRKSLMPIAEKYTLSQLSRALKNYFEKTNRIITLEYIMIKGINDKKEDAINLAEFAKFHKAKVNLIPYSKTDTNKYFSASKDININRFFNILVSKGINTTVRNSKGKGIDAACGQLVGMKKTE